MSLRKLAIVFTGLVFAVSVGCGADEGLVALNQTAPADTTSSTETGPQVQSTEPSSVARKPLIIKDGELRFETNDRKATWAAIRSAIQKYSGYIAEERQSQHGELLETTVVVRVPSEHFEAIVKAVSAGIGRFDIRHMHATEVTAQFVDLEARLKVKKAAHERISELLKSASVVDDVLKIETQITILQESIETAEGRLRLLKDQVTLSTLIITFYEDMPDIGPYFVSRLVEQLQLGWIGTQHVVLALATLWPLWVVIAMAGLVVKRIRTVRPTTV